VFSVVCWKKISINLATTVQPVTEDETGYIFLQPHKCHFIHQQAVGKNTTKSGDPGQVRLFRPSQTQPDKSNVESFLWPISWTKDLETRISIIEHTSKGGT
jgi:hypothetical protein